MTLIYNTLPTDLVTAWRGGAPDANGQPPERHGPSHDGDIPCRHCLAPVPIGQAYLLAACRPFTALHPYAEVGPVFVCAQDCQRGGGLQDVPHAMMSAPGYITRGYDHRQRIVGGTGSVVPTAQIPNRAVELLARPEIAFVDVRSAANNCYFFRITNGEPAPTSR